jgi:hypothetical protein
VIVVVFHAKSVGHLAKARAHRIARLRLKTRGRKRAEVAQDHGRFHDVKDVVVQLRVGRLLKSVRQLLQRMRRGAGRFSRRELRDKRPVHLSKNLVDRIAD